LKNIRKKGTHDGSTLIGYRLLSLYVSLLLNVVQKEEAEGLGWLLASKRDDGLVAEMRACSSTG
jgi:hypothetical protein